jgi:predicted RNA-binding Zn-ribbon protein involved in translation (DUF1610 family)
MSVAMHKLLTPIFADYGLSLERFFITSVLKPEDDKSYRRFKEIHFRQYADVAEAKLRQQVGLIDQQTAAQRMVIEAQGIAQKRSIEGYTYETERGFDVAERVGANQGVGQFTNMGIGMGMISGIGGTVGNKVGAMLQNAMGQSDGAAGQVSATTLKCASCGTSLQDGMKFCPSCGEKIVAETLATVICPKCGATVINAKFCSECGAALQTPVCPKCGKEVAVGAKFCPECGEKLS